VGWFARPFGATGHSIAHERLEETVMLTTQKEPRPTFTDRLASFLRKYRVALTITLIVLIVLVIAYFAWTQLQTSVREKSTVLAEEAQSTFQEWQSETAQDKKDTTEKKLSDQLDAILKRYPRQYAAQRAYMIRGELAYEKKEWADAAQSFTTLSRSFPDSYLAPLGLLYAGMSYEQSGETDRALETYTSFTKRFKDDFLMPRVLFSLGRLYEQKQDFKAAADSYNRLQDDFPLSNWTKVARNRIIELQTKGQIAE
jgi:tetratricopeptide (TPR) repeat protein